MQTPFTRPDSVLFLRPGFRAGEEEATRARSKTGISVLARIRRVASNSYSSMAEREGSPAARWAMKPGSPAMRRSANLWSMRLAVPEDLVLGAGRNSSKELREKPRRFRCYSEVTAMSAGWNTLGSDRRRNDAIKSASLPSASMLSLMIAIIPRLSSTLFLAKERNMFLRILSDFITSAMRAKLSRIESSSAGLTGVLSEQDGPNREGCELSEFTAGMFGLSRWDAIPSAIVSSGPVTPHNIPDAAAQSNLA